MDDLISRQAAIEILHNLYPSEPIMPINRKRWKEKYKPYIECEKAVEQLPSAQPEIIRCKECKHYIQNIHCVGGHYNGCEEWEHDGCEYPVEEDWFCCHAERRQDG